MIAAVAVLYLGGCRSGSKTAAGDAGEEKYQPRYARGFSIRTYGKSSMIDVHDPWQGARGVTYSLFVSHGGQAPPDGFSGTVVSAPVGDVICMSSSHAAFIDALGLTDKITGVSAAGYLVGENISRRRDAGNVVDIGYDHLINFELIASLRPSLVFIYGVGSENSVVTGKLDKLSIPYIYIGDYLENSPLGKAEWLVAFGEIFSQREKAGDIFRGIARRYDSVKTVALATTGRPKVMLNAPWKDKWFVPGDRSYMVELIRDAGGSYVCAGDDSERSRPISIETAWVATMKSDVWLCPNDASTISELLSVGSRFAPAPAITNGRVFNNNARSNAHGGSDFWESGTVKPDVVLRDMATILHPEAFHGNSLYYFKKLD